MREPNSAGQSASILKRWGPVAALIIALSIFCLLGWHRYFTLDALRENNEMLRAWVDASPMLALAIFILAYAAAVAISFPGATILTVFGGYLFGLWPGGPAVLIAATLGATIIFLASKSALNDFLSGRAGGFVKKMEAGFREDELNYMFVLRLVPLFPFWAINIVAGLLGVRLRNFFVGTIFGMIPGAFVYTSIGHAARAAIDAGEHVSLSGILLKPETLLPIAGLAVLALIPVVMKRFNKQASSLSAESNE